MKKTGAAKAAIAIGSRPRRFAWLAAGLFVAALGAACFDLARERNRALATGDEAMHALARVSDALWLADEARVHALLARLRVELRSGASWMMTDPVGSEEADPSVSRRRDTLLRRALEGAPDVRSIELVVAGPVGLVSVRAEPEVGPQTGAAEADEAEAESKALWYSEVVQRAVGANGRTVARSRIEVLPGNGNGNGDGEGRGSVRAAIALHDAEEVVQGVLVATIDLGPLASRLASLSTEQTRFAVVTPEGARIGGSSHGPMGTPSSLASDPELGKDGSTIAESDGRRSLLQPASRTGDEGSEVVFWIERDAPPSLMAAACTSPWLAVLAALLLLEGALVTWAREGSAAPALVAPEPGPRARYEASTRDDRAEAVLFQPADAPHASESEISIRRERFVLREWLSDVRGCLEREAATRGLTLDLRCERSLPREIEQDPLWLGGLVVSLGREALDVTSASRVALEVTGEADARLRFQLDAGDTDLESVPGMVVLAERLGATLEACGRGRLAVVVPA